MNTKKSLVVLISGSGSNLQAFIDQCASGELSAEIVCVISNKPEAYGLERARQAGIATRVIDHTTFESREAFDEVLAGHIASCEPDLIILAGFMRILTATFVEQFSGKLLNIHPSLLPKYKGLDTHQRAIDAGDEFAGVTVHFVTPELDGGPPALQWRVMIDDGDTPESLANKVLEKEHIIYPLAAQWFLQGRLKLKDNHALLDNNLLPPTGFDVSSDACS